MGTNHNSAGNFSAHACGTDAGGYKYAIPGFWCNDTRTGHSFVSSGACSFLRIRLFGFFASGVSSANKDIPQTIGWEDTNNGNSMGTFDPLSE